MRKISLIVPCYNEELTIPIFYNKISEVMDEMSYVQFEILFVDDGSQDTSLQLIKALRNSDSRVRYVSFSRNFGKEAALYAGLKHAIGDYVAVMDVDLQDPPELLIKMYNYLCEDGYDCVATRRANRKGESKIRSFFAHSFYKLMGKISKIEIVDGARDYRLMTRQMVDAVLEMGEYNRFSKGLFAWVGFHTKWLDYENIERVSGDTKWSFCKLLSYSLEGIMAFSTFPLTISTIVGIFLCFISFLSIILIVARRLVYNDPVQGWASTICIILFVGGAQLFCTGILGQYLAKTYLEVKHRPVYLVKETEESE